MVRDFAAGVDVIVNFAAESHVDRSLEAPGQFILTDVYGTFVLMDAAREHGHERFVQVSTDEVYGEVSSGLSVEGDPLQPRSPYSASKAGGELQVQAYRTSYGFPAIVTRGSNTYGPYQYPEKIIPLFITNAIDDRPLPIYGDGGAVRDYLYVEDHARGIDCALRDGVAGMDYNIGAGGETDGIAVADTVLRLLGKPGSLKQFVRDRLGHDRRYALELDAPHRARLAVRRSASRPAWNGPSPGLWSTRNGGDRSSPASSGSSTSATTSRCAPAEPRERLAVDAVSSMAERGQTRQHRVGAGPTGWMQLPDTAQQNRSALTTGRGSIESLRTVVVMPAYNAAKTLETTLAGIPPGVVDTIILVDDGSRDGTAALAASLDLVVISHPHNAGYGANQKTCYIEALRDGADVIVMLHPDGQYDPAILDDMVEVIRSGRADVVLGSRFLNPGGARAGGMPWWKRLANRFLTGYENRVLGTRTHRVSHRLPRVQPQVPHHRAVSAQLE